MKVIEEAPSGVFFVWSTTNVEDLLKTVCSRSLMLRFSVAPPQGVRKSLESIVGKLNIEISEEDLELIVLRSYGHMRDAHMLLDTYCLIGSESFSTLVKSASDLFMRYFMSIASKDKVKVLSSLEELSSFPLATLRSDFELFLLDISKAMVGIETNQYSDRVAKVFGVDCIKIIRLCMSDWVINAFSSETLFKASFLAMFQLLAGQTSRGVPKEASTLSSYAKKIVKYVWGR